MKYILVVDDSKLITQTLRNLIEEKLKLKCIVASTKKECESYLIKYRNQFEVALLDLGLPDAPNGEVIDSVSKFKIPIIVLTGSVESEDKFIKKDIVDYVVKDGAYSIYYALTLAKQLIKNKKIKTLVVDDSKVFLEQTKDLMLQYKLNVFTAEDGEEALKIIEQNPDIKLILTDYMMPKMDGLELTRRLRRKFKKSDLSIIVSSSSSDKGISSKFLKYGANDFLYKGFSKEEFYARLNSNLEILGLFEDIKSESEKNRKKDKLLFEQSKMATIGELLHNISHHWRQPLNLISTSAGSLKVSKELGVGDVEKELKSLDSIVDITQELSSTIENFKDFFATSNKGEAFEINDVIEKYIKLTHLSLKENDIEILTDFENNLSIINDKSQLKQVILNLLNNSKEALLLNEPKVKVIKIQTKKSDKEILISFIDSANGIKEELFDKIFEPYFSTKDEKNGTGLGLYVSREIITKQFNGSVNVKNVSFDYNGERLKGANFILKIPIEG